MGRGKGRGAEQGEQGVQAREGTSMGRGKGRGVRGAGTGRGVRGTGGQGEREGIGRGTGGQGEREGIGRGTGKGKGVLWREGDAHCSSTSSGR